MAELRELVEVERDAELWGQRYRVTPRLVEEPIGDGSQLIWFETMDSRPNFWVLRVDSLWDLNNVAAEQLEEIFEAIEDEYGSCICDEEPDEEDGPTPEEIAACAFPAFHDSTGGCRWGEYSVEGWPS
jgi:hypothetical protein